MTIRQKNSDFRTVAENSSPPAPLIPDWWAMMFVKGSSLEKIDRRRAHWAGRFFA